MPARHLQKVQAHAAAALVPALSNASPAEKIRQCRSFLRKEELRVRLLHRSGASGREVCAQRAALLDIVLATMFEQALHESTSTARVTLVATGGYGRGLLNPGSDVDLHFIHPERGGKDLSPETREIIEKVLYMLWDVGFKVGHAVRSLKETFQQANKDHQTKCALLESRFITGDRALYDEFDDNFHRQCIEGRVEEFLADRTRWLRDLHAKAGGTVHVQEPQVKSGCGGLRDYHNIIWITRVKLGTRTMEDLVRRRVISEIAWQECDRAHDFLLRVRNEMHYAEKNAADTLTLRLQGVVATNLGYTGRRMVQRCETFMRDYYHHARNLWQHNLSLMERFELERISERREGVFSFLAVRKAKREKFDSFYAQEGLIYPENEEIFREDSSRLMRLFQHCQLRQLRLSPQVRQLVKENYSVIGTTFRYNKANRGTFEAILSRKGEVGATLRQMHRVGFLGRYLPEFGGLTDLVQHEFFHRYTADEHTLKCTEKLDELSDTRDAKLSYYQKLFHDLEDPFILYLALIMHDTGRSENVREHAHASMGLTDQVCRRLQISDKRRRLLMFLVDHHLLMYTTATTKNLEDPDEIAEFARLVRSKEALDYLFLHQYADSRATNEAGWTDWKESLVRQLYHAAAAWFSGQEEFRNLAHRPASGYRTEVLSLLDETFAEEVDAHLGGMPERYFNFRSAKHIARHIKLVRAYRKQAKGSPETAPPALRWIARAEQGCSELILCCQDRHLLLAHVAGALAAAKLNILSADLFLRADGIVLDVFRVCTTDLQHVSTDDKATGKVADLLAKSFRGEDVDFDTLIKSKKAPAPLPEWGEEFPTRVSVSNDFHATCTSIWIQAVDRIGLLHDIFSAIGDLGLEITNARINTERGAAIDSFLVTDAGGGKVTDAATLQRLREAVQGAVGVPDGAGDK